MISATPASSVASLSSIDLRLGPSWYQAGALLVMHMGALVFLAPAALPLALKGLVSLGVVVSLVQTLRVYALRHSASAIVRLRWSSGGNWELEDAAGRRHRVHLADGGCVHPRLVILNFTGFPGPRRRRSVVITPDALIGGNLRQLRVLLRLQGARREG